MFIEHPAAVEVARLWRKRVGSALSLVLGIATGAAGLLVGAWTLTAIYRPKEAREAMAWVVAQVDAPWATAVQQFANDAMKGGALMFAGVVAAILCLLGWGGLQTARRSFYGPSKLNDDGRGRIELEAEPRVGTDTVEQTKKGLSRVGIWALGCFVVMFALPVLAFFVLALIMMLKGKA